FLLLRRPPCSTRSSGHSFPNDALPISSGLTVRRRSPAPTPARRPAAPDDTEPGRPAVAAAWAAGTRRGREGERPSAPSADAPRTATDTADRTTPHDAADDEGH
ncbi:hypothetical protein AB0J75_10745, partial [Streptomyces sp. NPDC049744]